MAEEAAQREMEREAQERRRKEKEKFRGFLAEQVRIDEYDHKVTELSIRVMRYSKAAKCELFMFKFCLPVYPREVER